MFEMNLRETLDRLVCLVFPPRCVICQELVPYGALFCGCCKWNPANKGAVTAKRPDGIDRICAAFAYESDISKAIYAMKMYRDKRMTSFYGDKIMETIADQWETAKFDLVACVPMSTGSLRVRGFNHAAYLAESVAAGLSLPMESRLLTKSGKTHLQRSLEYARRFENANHSYKLNRKKASLIPGKRILLVDDVLTTGATAGACARALKQGGAVTVSIATISSADPA